MSGSIGTEAEIGACENASHIENERLSGCRVHGTFPKTLISSPLCVTSLVVDDKPKSARHMLVALDVRAWCGGMLKTIPFTLLHTYTSHFCWLQFRCVPGGLIGGFDFQILSFFPLWFSPLVLISIWQRRSQQQGARSFRWVVGGAYIAGVRPRQNSFPHGFTFPFMSYTA